jgi:hypothetical protein
VIVLGLSILTLECQFREFNVLWGFFMALIASILTIIITIIISHYIHIGNIMGFHLFIGILLLGSLTTFLKYIFNSFFN